ncbi:unnamed protein product [Linum tenue]|uniref:sucrose-phosphate synthase n=1 Tax=Linum tenue TaxID=586396 RepID=A0AAV0MSF4_9ROSI|nr:unnamed protein product [Linum tenue]
MDLDRRCFLIGGSDNSGRAIRVKDYLVVVRVWLGRRGWDSGDWDGEVEIGRTRWGGNPTWNGVPPHCPTMMVISRTLIMGNRDEIDEMPSTNASVLLSVLKLFEKYDCMGKWRILNIINRLMFQTYIALLQRLRPYDCTMVLEMGVFSNSAFIEPFGLTLIEAAAYGLPMVATKNGGPVDILRVLDNGLLIGPHDQQSIATALLKLVANKQLWAKCRQNGLKNIHLF